MENKYLWVTISAENQQQADEIMNSLLEKKIITGGQMLNAPARFLWKGEITNLDYFILTAYTLQKHKEQIITEVEKVSIEEVPMITFLPFDGNQILLDWIEETLS